jgi:hypothetical protein
MMSDESMVGAGASAAAPEWQAAADEIIAEYAGEDRETKHEMIAWAKETLWADEAFCVNAVAYVAKGLGVGVKGLDVINVKPPAAAKPLPKPVASEGLSLPAPSVEAGDLAFDIRALRARMDRASPWDGSLAKAAEEAGEKRVIKPAEASPRLPAMIEHRPRAEPGLRGEIKLPIAAAAAEQVHLLNQKHQVIGNYGGKCMVLSWERWEINQRVMIPTFQTFGDFQNRYKNRYVQRQIEDGGVKNVPAGKFWLSAPDRVTFDKVVEPGEAEVLEGNRLNLWRGFAVQPRLGAWLMLREHIYRVLGAGDPKAYIIRWLAWMFQNPGSPAEAVLAFQGEEGSGKGTLARVMLQIFGAAALPISDPNMLPDNSAAICNIVVSSSSMRRFGTATFKPKAD